MPSYINQSIDLQSKFNDLNKKGFWRSGSLRSKKFLTGVFWKSFKCCLSVTLEPLFYTKRNSFKSVFARILLIQLRNEKIQTVWKVSIYGVFSGPYFLAFGLNTERYSVPLHIQPKCRKRRTRKSSVIGQISRSNSFFKEDIVAHYSMKIISFFPVTVFSKHPDIMLFTRFCIYVPEYLLTLIQKEILDVIWLDDCKKYH